jgi:hypothetical protein
VKPTNTEKPNRTVLPPFRYTSLYQDSFEQPARYPQRVNKPMQGVDSGLFPLSNATMYRSDIWRGGDKELPLGGSLDEKILRGMDGKAIKAQQQPKVAPFACGTEFAGRSEYTGTICATGERAPEFLTMVLTARGGA